MNKEETRAIAIEQAIRLRQIPYKDLLPLVKKKEMLEVSVSSGKKYSVILEALWADKPGGNLKVLIVINEAILKSAFPVTENLVISPAGDLIETSLERRELLEEEVKYPIKFFISAALLILVLGIGAAFYFYSKVDKTNELQRLQAQAEEVQRKLKSGELKAYQYDPNYKSSR